MAVTSKDYTTATGQLRPVGDPASRGAVVPGTPGLAAGGPGGELAAMEVLRARMPHDGGIQRGMAPSVAASAFTGAATVAISVPASPARSFEPALTVRYSSHAGDGVFGLGFALDLAPVQRRTNLRTPRYDDTDSFQLGDVPLARLGQRDITRVIGGVSYLVATYASRSAATTDRIEHWTPAGGEPGFWRVISEAGVITVYGVTEQARIADPADPRRVFTWLPQARYDGSGSAIGYDYKQEDDEGVADAIYERNRQRGANRYPRSITYGNEARFLPAAPLDLPPGPWHVELVFDYGEYDFSPGNDNPYQPVRPWPARDLPFSDYSAGFEQRTHRLCRTIGLFHRFDDLGPAPVLARTLALDYDQAASGGLATHLVRARERGHRLIPARPAGERYWTADEPATEFGYAVLDPAGAQFEPLLTRVPGVPPVASQARSYCLADLDGYGVSGIVYADSASLLYWRPVLDPADLDGPVRFTPEQPVPIPAERQVSGQFQLGDVTGDGRMSLIVDAPDRSGFYGRTADGQWRPFIAFAGHVTDSPVRGGQPGPPRDAALPAQRAGNSGASPAEQYARADLTGNGLPDLVRITYDAVSYAANLGEAGFAAFWRANRPASLPPVTSSERAGVRVADVLGGGEQLVLVQSGRLTCWPSLGYGEFGAPVELGGVPRFDDVPDDAVFLADLTGTGPADLILLRPGRVEVYLNQGGNAFSPVPLTVTTPVATPGTLTVGEVTTDGRRSLVFSTGGQQPRHYALTLGAGASPFRLTEFDAGCGTRTRLSYATSARMRLRDEARGQPWHVDLPFPVTVVETITTDDEISAVRTTVMLSYRDGYFDATERTFTGFARVDKTESEEILPTEEPMPAPGTGTEPGAVAPTLTKTWFHVGQFAIPGFDRALEREYFPGDPDAYPMPGPTFDWGDLLPDASLLRQGHLALAGAPRRVEVYDAARPAVPYRVQQGEQAARLLAPPTDGIAAFVVHERESIAYAYEAHEQVALDPAVRHTFTLEVNEFGDVTRDATVSYRRRDTAALPGQDQTVVVARLWDYLPARDEPDLLLHGFDRLERTYAITGIEPPLGGLYYHEGQIAGQVEQALRGDAPAAAELMAAERTSYDGASGGQAPPEPLAAPPRVRRRDVAAFTGAQISDLLAGVPLPLPVEQFLTERGGYEHEASTDLWWQVGESMSYRPELFWQPARLSDPVAAVDPARGSIREFSYDQTAMAMAETTLRASDGSLADQRTTVELTDYQTLLPQRVRDPNGMISEVLYDPLGRVFATAFRGQAWADGAAREVGFPPLPTSDPAAWPQPADVTGLGADPARFLGAAAAFTFYDTDGWRRHGVPVLSATVTAADYQISAGQPGAGGFRAIGGSGVPPGQQGGPPGQHSLPPVTVDYLDGDNRPVQTSIRVDADAGPGFRWAVTARTRYTGTGQPLQRYLPVFTGSPAFVTQAELDQAGTGPVYSYDPVDRQVRADIPRGSFPRAFYATKKYLPWSVTTADVDDTVTSSAYYQYYIDGGHPLPPREREALVSAAAFDGTPTTRHLGVLGDTVALDELLTPQKAQRSLFRYDAAGRQVSAADPRQAEAGRVNFTLRYGLTAEPLQVISADAGPTITLTDVAGAPLLLVDGRGVTRVLEHDALHRIIAVTVTGLTDGAADGARTAVMAERYLYGDTLDPDGATIFPNPAERGLLGRLCVSYDEAGRHETAAYALTGQPLTTAERFTVDITADPDWRAGAWATWAELFADLAGQLEPDGFAATAWYDPAGKALTTTDPGGNTTTWHYDAAGGVGGIDLAVGTGPAEPYATGISYDAARQRRSAGYAAAGQVVIRREFGYDPASLLLTSVRGVVAADGRLLQDLGYVYDPASNLTFAGDPAAPGTTGAAGAMAAPGAVSPDLGYGYDALYRLTSATGRAVATFGAADAESGRYEGVYAPPTDPALDRYTATFHYDKAGNCDRQEFTVGQRTWTTTLAVADDSNRATPGAVFDPAAFDHAGNTLRLPSVPALAWDYQGALRSAQYSGPAGGAAGGTEHYAYSARTRRRKLTADPSGAVTDIRYFATLDIVRQADPAGAVVSEYQRIKLADPGQSFGEVIRWTAGSPPPGMPTVQRRFLLDNLVGSAMLELADDASVISYEEYSPFGTTVFATGPSFPQVALKAYRYTGQDRDQASGLAYHGARYYAPWLTRWISPDPAGTVDGLNLYAYAGNNPTTHLDPTGLVRQPPLPKYLNGIKKHFGTGAARMVHKSRRLRERVRLLGRRRWRVIPMDAPGAEADRERLRIRINRAYAANPHLFTQTLSHEAGHAGYAMPAPIPQAPGMTRDQFVQQNVRQHMVDEGEATIFNAEVRAELMAAGHGDIGIAGQRAAQYQAIHAQHVAGAIDRPTAIGQMADQFAHEVTSTTGQTYEEYYGEHYDAQYI